MNDGSSRAHPEREAIERFFQGEIDPDDWKPLVLHLRGCDACRTHYLALRKSRLSERERALPDLVLGERETELAASLALARFEQRRSRRRRAAGIGALALAASLALVIALPRPSPSDEGIFTAKGGGNEAVGAEVLCFPAGEVSTPVILKADGKCAPGSRIKLKAVSLDARLQEVVAVVLGPGQTYKTSLSGELPATSPVTLKGYLTLGDHEKLSIAFVFSEKPLSEAALRKSVEGLRSGGHAELRVEGVTLAQRVITIEAGETR